MPKEKLAPHPQPTDYDKDKAAARVCYVQGAGGNLGSGRFVDWNGRPCIITNNHILQDEQQAGEATVLFNYRISKDTAILCHTLRGVLILSSPFSEPMNSRMVDADHLDYTLVEVAELSTVTPLVLWPTFDARVQNHSQWSRAQVCVIGHPYGDARASQQGAIKSKVGNTLSSTHFAVTHGGSSGSPVFLHTKSFPLLGFHYWGDDGSGSFIYLEAIVTDLMKKEIIRRAGKGFDPCNPIHVNDVTDLAASLAALPTQVDAFELLDELAPCGGSLHAKDLAKPRSTRRRAPCSYTVIKRKAVDCLSSHLSPYFRKVIRGRLKTRSRSMEGTLFTATQKLGWSFTAQLTRSEKGRS